MLLLPAVAGMGIQDILPWDARIPERPFQRKSGAGLDAPDAGAAGAPFSRLAALRVQIREERAEPDPGTVPHGHEPAIASDPAQASPRRGSLVRELGNQLLGIHPS